MRGFVFKTLVDMISNTENLLPLTRLARLNTPQVDTLPTGDHSDSKHWQTAMNTI
jgi:hypothetical protein